MKRSAAPREEEAAPIDKGCARNSIRAALHRETRRAVHRHHVRRPARHPILVAIESIHLIPPWLDESFQNLPLMPGFRQRPQLGFKATRMLIPLRTRRLFVQCLWCMQPSTRCTLATLTIKKFLSPAWRLELRCHIALYLCEFSAFVFANKLEQIGPNSSEDEAREGGVSGRGRGCSQRWVPDNSGRFVCVFDSLTVVVNAAPTSQWAALMLRFQWLLHVAHSVLGEGDPFFLEGGFRADF